MISSLPFRTTCIDYVWTPHGCKHRDEAVFHGEWVPPFSSLCNPSFVGLARMAQPCSLHFSYFIFQSLSCRGVAKEGNSGRGKQQWFCNEAFGLKVWVLDLKFCEGGIPSLDFFLPFLGGFWLFLLSLPTWNVDMMAGAAVAILWQTMREKQKEFQRHASCWYLQASVPQPWAAHLQASGYLREREKSQGASLAVPGSRGMFPQQWEM